MEKHLMIRFFKMSFAALYMVFVAGLSACSSDSDNDNDVNVTASDIVGRWQISPTKVGDLENLIISIQTNGNYSLSYSVASESEGITETGTYTLNQNTVTFKSSAIGGNITFAISSFSETSLKGSLSYPGESAITVTATKI